MPHPWEPIQLSEQHPLYTALNSLMVHQVAVEMLVKHALNQRGHPSDLKITKLFRPALLGLQILDPFPKNSCLIITDPLMQTVLGVLHILACSSAVSSVNGNHSTKGTIGGRWGTRDIIHSPDYYHNCSISVFYIHCVNIMSPLPQRVHNMQEPSQSECRFAAQARQASDAQHPPKPFLRANLQRERRWKVDCT